MVEYVCSTAPAANLTKMDLKMDVDLLKIVNEGEPGYRTPTAHGTVDVFHKLKRYIFLTPVGAREAWRVEWRAAVARFILGSGGKSSDVIRIDHVPHSSVGVPARPAKQYRIGELKKPGSQVVSRRRPGDPPLHGAASLELVEVIQLGDPRRDVAGWGKRRGCFLVLDGVTGAAYFFRADSKPRMYAKDQVIHAWFLNDGPPVEVRGKWPAWVVVARQWSPEERSALAAQRAKSGRRARFGAALGKDRKDREKARAEKAAAIAAEKAARGRIAEAANLVTMVSERLKRAEVSAARWPGAEKDEAVIRLRAWVDKAWVDYLRQVEVDKGKLRGVRGPRVPAGRRASVGLLPRPAWVTLPGSEGDD